MSELSIIDFQMTMADLSVAEHALREEPYERLPYLAGSLAIAQMRMEQLRQEAIRLREQLEEKNLPRKINLSEEAERMGIKPHDPIEGLL